MGGSGECPRLCARGAGPTLAGSIGTRTRVGIGTVTVLYLCAPPFRVDAPPPRASFPSSYTRMYVCPSAPSASPPRPRPRRPRRVLRAASRSITPISPYLASRGTSASSYCESINPPSAASSNARPAPPVVPASSSIAPSRVDSHPRPRPGASSPRPRARVATATSAPHASAPRAIFRHRDTFSVDGRSCVESSLVDADSRARAPRSAMRSLDAAIGRSRRLARGARDARSCAATGASHAPGVDEYRG